jgi:hypothetical protein
MNEMTGGEGEMRNRLSKPERSLFCRLKGSLASCDRHRPQMSKAAFFAGLTALRPRMIVSGSLLKENPKRSHPLYYSYNEPLVERPRIIRSTASRQTPGGRTRGGDGWLTNPKAPRRHDLHAPTAIFRHLSASCCTSFQVAMQPIARRV